MNRKNLILLALVFLILAVISVYPVISQKFFPRKSVKPPDGMDLVLVKPDNINKFNIESPSGILEFNKSDGAWKVASYTASLEGVNNFIDSVNKSVDFTLVSKSEANQNEFGFGPEDRIKLTFSGNFGTRSLLIGRAGPQTSSFYAKAENSNNVYLATGDLRNLLKTDINDWRNKTITKFDTGNLGRIEVKSDRTFAVYKKNDKWFLNYKGKDTELKSEDINFTLSQVSNLTGSGFLDDMQNAEFNKNSKLSEIVFKNSEDKVISQITYLKKETDYWVKSRESADVLTLSASELDNLLNLPDKSDSN